MKHYQIVGASAIALILFSIGCGGKSAQTNSNGSGTSSPTQPSASGVQPSAPPAPQPEPPPPLPPVVIPTGTVLAVHLQQGMGSKASQQGERFSTTLAAPVVVGSEVVVPKGANVYGVVTEAHPAGKFKGGATLKLAFTRLEISGKPVVIKAAGITRISKGKGKRTAALVGGGAVGGALIGGLAGGGKGLAIGALAGAGAGTAGAGLTGNDRDITLPAGTSLHVRLTAPITVPQ